ncbi:MAG: ATP-binding protein [candidate division KSB1 bacterium]|nr:ATP-binding protein [candidate division KSB1 bacterium]
MSPVVSTIETKCRRCYSCIRQCPAKAIKFEKGQARVLAERCIACGNCIQVCPQHAKRIRDGTEKVKELLRGSAPVFAVVAPSIAAAFDDVSPLQIVTALRRLGFQEVWEVAFGADLVVEAYRQIFISNGASKWISSPCPALVVYIEKYRPSLIPFLVPIVSPMIAVGRAVKQKYCPEAAVVFIGPCIAKKKEMEDPDLVGTIDEVLTYDELDSLFRENGIDAASMAETTFDGPVADLGRAFPVSAGLLKCLGKTPDCLETELVVCEGRDRVIEVLSFAENQDAHPRFYDLLFCRGCINGPVMNTEEPLYRRLERLAEYIRNHTSAERKAKAKRDRQSYADVDLGRRFSVCCIAEVQPTEEQIREVLRLTGKLRPEDELNCGACGYPSCREKAAAVVQGLAEAEMCLPYMLERTEQIQRRLASSNRRLKKSLESLKAAQEQLLQSAKLASVGKLAAGVAHELNNPLGGILLYANILLKKLEDHPSAVEIKQIAAEAERCRHIVQGLLEFSRQAGLHCQAVSIQEIIESTLKLINEQAIFRNIEIKKFYNEHLPPVYADRLQIQQVLLNLFVNAAEAMNSKGVLTIAVREDKPAKRVYVSVQDTGTGMSKKVQEKIFDPFFTTKPVGKGTGLGLAIVYGIIKRHHGDIRVESRIGKGSTFTFYLPTADSPVAAGVAEKRL